ncbi:AAA family ATPase [Prochlorococcus sp. MIT 1307]|uniref:DNA repair protein RecN n=1 Tax=Prochlorococcus sp. MIT 1307 TaxID=3096219 RepID=UPI002A7613EC|nr:AAA family ATPase [Prochlorococcus sp. MIT 1307]
MLVGLRLQNIALLDCLELTFEEGFTVLTGETGAGKSILLDALDALFGGSQSVALTRLLSPGAKYGHIEASFSRNDSIDSWLKNEDFDADDSDLLISRELRLKEGRLINRCRVNGVVINRHQIASLRPLLIDLTVQGQTQQLASTTNQLVWLDRLGSIRVKEASDKVKCSWQIWHQAFLALEKAKIDSDKFKKESEDLESLLEELEDAQLDDPLEDSKLEKEQDRLVHGVKLREGLEDLFFKLQEGSDNHPSLVDQLGISLNLLKDMTKLDSDLIVYLNKTFDLHYNLENLISELKQYSSMLETDYSTLEEVQVRLSILKKLQRRYNLTLPELLERREELRLSQRSNDIEKLLKKLALEESLAREKRDQNNCALTKIRQDVASQFENHLMKYLRLLGLLNVRFEVQFNPSMPNEKGADTVQFLFSANPGQNLAPLMDVASGGEMSRFLLALKTVLSQVDGSSTLFFDEIDAGVSGRVSGAIATVLKDLAGSRQVFCVTHQPLVAAVADHHFRVVKSVENGITNSQVISLSNLKDRQTELAELAGGNFEEARLYAASLLEQQAA